MIELRRTRAGLFNVDDSYTLEKIQEGFKEWKEKNNETKLREMLIPAEIVKQIVTSLQVKEESVKGLLNGKPLMKEDLVSPLSHDNENSNFAVFNVDRFIGIYKKVEENNIIARAEFVMN